MYWLLPIALDLMKTNFCQIVQAVHCCLTAHSAFPTPSLLSEALLILLHSRSHYQHDKVHLQLAFYAFRTLWTFFQEGQYKLIGFDFNIVLDRFFRQRGFYKDWLHGSLQPTSPLWLLQRTQAAQSPENPNRTQAAQTRKALS